MGLTSRKTIGFILMDAERYRIFKLTIATAVYNQRFDFVREITPTNFIEKTDVLCDDEYLVLRTRVKKDTQGVIVSANYSKIYGMFAIDRILYFRESFFNPTPNDPNLEYNGKNLAPRRR